MKGIKAGQPQCREKLIQLILSNSIETYTWNIFDEVKTTSKMGTACEKVRVY